MYCGSSLSNGSFTWMISHIKSVDFLISYSFIQTLSGCCVHMFLLWIAIITFLLMTLQLSYDLKKHTLLNSSEWSDAVLCKETTSNYHSERNAIVRGQKKEDKLVVILFRILHIMAILFTGIYPSISMHTCDLHHGCKPCYPIITDDLPYCVVNSSCF